MTEMQRQQGQQERWSPAGPGRTQPSGWVGWVLFAGIMLCLVGVFQGIAGLIALLNDDVYVVKSGKLLVDVSYTTWGWVHLVLGAVSVLAGLGVMAGQTWARVYGIVLACLAAVANLGFLPAYPIWSTIMITMDVLIIWALAVHGREVQYLD